MAKAPNRISTARREYSRRKGISFTQQDAAKEFGVSLSAYRNWEQGKNLPNAGIANMIAKKYGVTVDYLLGYIDVSIPGSIDITNQNQTLNDDEREVIDLYRKCNLNHRTSVKIFLKMLSEIPSDVTVWYPTDHGVIFDYSNFDVPGYKSKAH